MAANIGWQFYRDYYSDLYEESKSKSFFDNYTSVSESKNKPDKKSEEFFNTKNADLLGLKPTLQTELFRNTIHSFTAKTTYPGLIIGSGYGHGTGTQGEFKLGFYFDWATGLPVIPGSSVKGILRSVFPSREDEVIVKANKIKLIKYLLPKDITEQITEQIIEKLETEIFGTSDGIGKDVFHDAFIFSGNGDGKIFGDDYITPHGDDPLRNPIPVRFLKILPKVTFQFNFNLKANRIADVEITAKDKKDLFEKILKMLGVGAKTNVGYGQFI